MMAITKAKRYAYPSKAARREDRRASTRQISLPKTRLFRFREVKGKIVEAVEFSSAPDHQDLTIRFRDKTGINFSFKTVFTLKA